MGCFDQGLAVAGKFGRHVVDNHPDDIGSLLLLGEQIAGQSDKNEKGEGRFHFNAGIASRCRVSRRSSV